jgi:hypothetical protein
MQWSDNTVICTYRVREGARETFLELLKKHWPTLRAAGLVTDTPPLIFESIREGGRHDEQGTTFVEIFSWLGPESAGLAHQMPAVMAVWEPMGAHTEARDGRPAMEFPHFRPLELAAA